MSDLGTNKDEDKFDPDIRSLAYAMESMSFYERCQAIHDLAEEQHTIGMKNGRFGYIPRSTVEKAIGEDIYPDFDDELESVEDWEYYQNYKSNAGDFVSGYNIAKSEIRKDLGL